MTQYLKNFYSSIQQYSSIASVAFDEGPILNTNQVGINSSSIETAQIDQFRQGVEITQEKYARVGLYKISAGTPGHIVRPLCYGVNDVDISNSNSFAELDRFDPVVYIRLSGSAVKSRMVSSEEDFLTRGILYNGTIEPLTIRTTESFLSVEAPFTMHAARGELMDGNSDLSTFSCEQILTVDYVPKTLVAVNGSTGRIAGNISYENKAWFLDADNVSRKAPGSGSMFTPKVLQQNGSVKYFLTDLSGTNRTLNTVVPYDDTQIYLRSLGITSASHGDDMVRVFAVMTGSTGNYVPPGKKSATTGFVYDNIGYVGTDSIAFGGMTY